MLDHNSDWPVSPVRQRSGTEFIENDAQRVDITTRIKRLAFYLFRREVKWSDVTTIVAPQIAKAKIGKNRLTNPTLRGNAFIEQNIGRLDIAVDNIVLMHIIDSQAARCKNMNDLRTGRKPARASCTTNIIC